MIAIIPLPLPKMDVIIAIPKLKAMLGRLYYQLYATATAATGSLQPRALKPDQGLPSRLGTSLLVSRRDAKP